jgi:hypothetical protein
MRKCHRVAHGRGMPSRPAYNRCHANPNRDQVGGCLDGWRARAIRARLIEECSVACGVAATACAIKLELDRLREIELAIL